jgi:hypothetical protein
MLTYQIRPRVFRHAPGTKFVFPAECQITIQLQPGQPFGTQAGGGRTAVHGVAGRVLFNANNGDHYIESKPPLSPLNVTIEEPHRTVKLVGSTLTLEQRFNSLDEIQSTIECLYFLFPALLTINFADPPFIESVAGNIGATPFSWELNGWTMPFCVTSQEYQERHISIAWSRIRIVQAPERRRLQGGIHYFHQACRLARAGKVVGEFIGEVLLNLSKTLEVLFPNAPKEGTRDAIRRGLREVGIPDSEIEFNFMPAVALRNEVDVGHVHLGLFTMDELKIIHEYTERAESAFRKLMDRLLIQVETGSWDVAPYNFGPSRGGAASVIDALRISRDSVEK